MISQLNDPALLAELALDAKADGRTMVARLMAEWADGSNRFNRLGERAYFAVSQDHVVAVCGLNIDPFAGDPVIGRVRRLYVAVAQRRRGLGSAIMKRVTDDARDHFHMLHLRTDDADASAFYEAIGFDRITDKPNCTHCRSIIE
jgi:predicted GNAT family acetyltransferase